MPDRARRLIIFILVAVFIFIGFLLFRSGPKKPAAPKASVKAQTVLTDYITKDSRVQFTNDGQINSDEKHRAIRISVSANETTIDILQGYQGSVADSRQHANNQEAYDNFLNALSRAGYTRTRVTKLTDDKGVCPLGSRYYLELFDSGIQIQRLWSTSCGGFGTSGSNISLVQTLFRKQVPEYDSLTASVQL